jgi:hypothetical protein
MPKRGPSFRFLWSLHRLFHTSDHVWFFEFFSPIGSAAMGSLFRKTLLINPARFKRGSVYWFELVFEGKRMSALSRGTSTRETKQ